MASSSSSSSSTTQTNEHGIFSNSEYKTLTIICDTIFSDDSQLFEQALQQGESTYEFKHKFSDENGKEKYLGTLKEFYKRKASDLDVAGHFFKLISTTKTASQIGDLKTLLGLFSTAGAGFILTGQFGSFISQPLKTRQQILTMMSSSSNPIRRQAYKAIVPLVISLYFSVISGSGEGVNPNWDVCGYTAPSPPEQIPGKEKLTFIKINSETSLKADVVVIGSGAGGGVTASILAKAGYRVIVVEKGGYLSPNNMSWKEAEAFPLLYEQAGTLTSDDLSVNILAGSCLGGGTTVNWTASIKTPEPILNEWRKSCPNAFESERWNQAMESVSKRINVNTIDSEINIGASGSNNVIDIDTTSGIGSSSSSSCNSSINNNVGINNNNVGGNHSKNNLVLLQALRDLDDDPQPLPRDVKNCDTTQCGSCSMGCRSKSKQSSLVTYLEDCCSNGGQIITNCQIEEITYVNGNGSTAVGANSGGEKNSSSGQSIHGVIGYVSTPDGQLRYRIFIKANIVVCSAGAIHTPALLLKSRIKNANIGNNLYLHPVLPVIAEYDSPVEIWNGPPMTVIGKKYQTVNPSTGITTGAILETPNAHIGLASSNCGFMWQDSFNFKRELEKIDHYAAFIAINRDTTPGKIRLDKDGRTPKIQYKLSNQDWKSFLPAYEGLIRSLLSSPNVKSAAIPVNGFKRAYKNTVEDYIKTIRSNGYKSNQTVILSAHQMGSCRMGTNKSNSVVNENGESWEIKRLFVSDGSVLPTSVGINPMLTIYAISHIIANQIITLYPPQPTQ